MTAGTLHAHANLIPRLRVFLGKDGKNHGGFEYKAKTAVLHPKRDKALFKNDIAIITLGEQTGILDVMKPAGFPAVGMKVIAGDEVGRRGNVEIQSFSPLSPPTTFLYDSHLSTRLRN